MNYSLTQIILVTGDIGGEDTIWMQMMVLVVLAVLLGIGSLIKTRAKRFKDQEQDYTEDSSTSYAKSRWQIKPLKKLKDNRLSILETAQPKAVIEEPVLDFDAPDIASREKPKSELAAGMEILELDFLLSIVENTKGDDKNDVIMRKLNFNELFRREQLNEIDSNALKFYAMDEGNLYGRGIQCAAMKELTIRTARKSKNSG